MSAQESSTTVYLDHAATTPLDPRVREVMAPWLAQSFGNPSSRHRAGIAATQAIDAARIQVARAVGAGRAQIVFTSGGTEANNLGVLGAARARAKLGKHVLVGPSEHACVRAPAQALASEGFEVETLALTRTGALDLEHAASKLRADTVLVAQMFVQNEVGTIYPVRELARLVRARSQHASIHVDAVQAFGKVELSFVELGCDTLALAAHKLHGPQGAGALIVREGHALQPLVHGGGQERGLRSGTENVAGIVGFGRAAELAELERATSDARVRELRAQLLRGLASSSGARVLETGTPQLGGVPGIVAVLLPGLPSEVRMHHLEELGVVVSAGSACQSKKTEQSPVLTALGIGHDDARTMLRISLSRMSTPADIERFLAAARAVETQHAPARA